MRRLTRRDDRGLAAIMVVVAMPALLMLGSLVFDGARGVLAARQTQNSADAAALAKAIDCANGNTGTDVSGYATNGTALVAAICSPDSRTSGKATATMSKNIVLAFAAGGGTKTVTRPATARWGGGMVTSAATIPAVISKCVFDISTTNGLPSSEQVIPIGGGATNCPGDPPGNFGWLNASGCTVTTTLTSAGTVTAPGSNGNGSGQPYGCINNASHNGSGLNSELLFPIYTASSGTGTNVIYTISGYAQFHLTGWEFQNGPSPKNYPSGGLPSCSAHDCIRGYFVNFVTGQGSIGPSPFGAITVQLYDPNS